MEDLRINDFALLDENNVVFNIVIITDHDNLDFIEHIRIVNNAASIISCREKGLACINGKWNGEHFVDIEGNKVPPILPPDENNFYHYDFDKNEWVNLNLDYALLKEMSKKESQGFSSE